MASSTRGTRVLTIIGALALALAISVAAIFLGRWQWHRHDVRAEEMAAFDAGQSQAAAPLASVLRPDAGQLPDGARWRTATVSGRFHTESLTWLRNRPVGGKPATHALAWFVTDDGRALLVDAGWIDAGAVNRPGLPKEQLTLTVTLRPVEADDGKRGDSATRITPSQVPQPPAPAYPGYGVVAEACQDPCGPLPGLVITPLPHLSLGPHMSYAAQWYLLALAAPTLVVVWFVRQRRETAEIPKATREPKVRRRRAEPSDEEIEDAL